MAFYKQWPEKQENNTDILLESTPIFNNVLYSTSSNELSESMEDLTKTQIIGSQTQTCWFSTFSMGSSFVFLTKFPGGSEGLVLKLYFENHCFVAKNKIK